MLKPNRQEAIPEETIKVAKAAFPMGKMYLSLRDTLGPIYEDGMFQDLYPSLGQPAESPGRLALVTVMQYVEDLSDRQAAEAMRRVLDEDARMAPDWLRENLKEAWIKRYERRLEGYRLPASQAKREQLAVEIGMAMTCSRQSISDHAQPP